MEQDSGQGEGARSPGSGEIHIVRAEKCAFVVPAREVGEALRMSSRELEFSMRWPDASVYLSNLLFPVRMFGLDIDLEVFIHCVKRPPRSTRLGTLQLRGTRILFNGMELGEEGFWRWLDACMDRVWEDWTFDRGRATELAKLVAADRREIERKSLETLRRTLGEEVAERLLRKGEITVKSSNGKEYVITERGEVFETPWEGGKRSVCVQVAGEHRLPKYDRVLAKYLVIRDHPEQIETLGGGSPLEMERERLRGEIAALKEHLAVLKGRLAMLGE